MRRFAVSVVFCLAACSAPPRADSPRAHYAGNLAAVLDADPLLAGEKVKFTVIKKTPRATIQLIQLRVDVPPHFHKHSDELVEIVRGKGTMTMDGKDYPAKPGDFFFIPKGAVHAFKPASKTAAVLSIFTPAFRQGDRTYRR